MCHVAGDYVVVFSLWFKMLISLMKYGYHRSIHGFMTRNTNVKTTVSFIIVRGSCFEIFHLMRWWFVDDRNPFGVIDGTYQNLGYVLDWYPRYARSLDVRARSLCPTLSSLWLLTMVKSSSATWPMRVGQLPCLCRTFYILSQFQRHPCLNNFREIDAWCD